MNYIKHRLNPGTGQCLLRSFGACLAIFILTSLTLVAQPQSLFDGKTLDQWEGNPAIWRVEDKAITAFIAAGESLRKNEFLYWKGTVTDFDLSLQYRGGDHRSRFRKFIHKASGRGQVEDMAVNTVDLSKHLGQMIRVRVVDEHTGGWGHINYDDFRIHKEAPKASVVASSTGRLSASPLLWNFKPNPAGKPGDITSSMSVPGSFMMTHQEFFRKQHRLGMLVRQIEKMGAEKRAEHNENAAEFVSS